MKLYFIFPLSGPNNGVKVISNYIKEAIFKNKDIFIFPIDTAQAKGYDNFGKFNINKLFSFFSLLKKILMIKKEDYVYMNITPKGYAFYRDLIILLCSSFKSKNITVHIHANDLESNIKWYNRFLFKKIKIIVINENQLIRIKRFCPNTFLIPNSLPDYFKGKPIQSKEKNKISFIFLSNISKEKGINRLIDISNKLFENSISCNLNIYGGALNQLELQKVENLSSKYDFVNYHGPIYNDKDKFTSLLNNEILLFLSDENYEVYPLVYIESLMCGLPILTTKQIVADNFKNLGVAYILKENLSNFNDILGNLRINETKIKDLKEKTRNVYLKNYSFQDYVEKLENLILYDTKKIN